VPALAALALAACSASPVVTTRTLTIHAPKACAPGASPYALFQPLGDFEAQGATPPSIPLADVGAQLAGFPPATAEIVATVADATSAQWDAHAVLAATGNVDLLALPVGAPCALTDPIGARAGAVLGAVDAGHVLVVGGMASAAGGAVPATALVDLTRGTVSTLAAGLLTPRTEATVTAWSGGAVVAGGVQPPSSGGSTEASFEVYSSALGDFTGAKFALSQARARHGAAVLASGETLLVGGVDGTGAVLGSMEAIDATTQRARTAGLGQLAVPRADPVVMRLASGEILVAGGVDAAGAPVATLEWFPADASAATTPTRDLVTSSNVAFIPLGAGGALAVVAPDTPSTTFQNTWVISADHELQAATPIVAALTAPRLFDGVEQAPALWTGDLWLVWQPWVGSFKALTAAIGGPGPSGDPVASAEPGLGVWTDGTTVFALRTGARGPYATPPLTSPLLLTDTNLTAPDRLVTDGAVTFDPSTGLSLQPGASVFVTDATFASFTLDAETPTGAPPLVVLRDAAGNETILDARSCGFTPGATIHVERDGDVVKASAGGGALGTCSVAPASGARVSIGVRGEGPNVSVVASLAITRT
jgi:hypothetical protein